MLFTAQMLTLEQLTDPRLSIYIYICITDPALQSSRQTLQPAIEYVDCSIRTAYERLKLLTSGVNE